MMMDLSVAALGTGADHGGDTSTVTNTAPVNLTARSTSDSASAPILQRLSRTVEQASRTLERRSSGIRTGEQTGPTREHSPPRLVRIDSRSFAACGEAQPFKPNGDSNDYRRYIAGATGCPT